MRSRQRTNEMIPDEKICRACKAGSCCYEGVELTKKEMGAIIKCNPKIAKPWFRIVEDHEDLEDEYPFTTIIRKGTCVFQDEDNRCMVYQVRPRHCREFPLQDGRPAPYLKRLCVLFYEQWPNNVVKRIFTAREKGSGRK